jgi:hypothetical protein
MKNTFNKIKGFFKKFFWFKTELMKMYSSQPSYFSKKRVESGIAFFIAQFGMVFFILKKIDTMDVYELSIWAAMEFLIAGYTVNQIQKEKKYRYDDYEHHDDGDRKILNS